MTSDAASRLPPPAPASPPQVTRIEPARGWALLDFKELWERRELFYFLAWRDIKVRYKQTAFGAAWAVAQPFLTMVVFSIFFGRLAKIPSEGVPYPLFAYAALLPWAFFSSSLTQASNSLVVTPDLITKVYFPRVIVPAASVVAGLADFAIAFLVLAGMMVYFGVFAGITSLLVIPLLILALVTALGVGFWLAALNVEYRDVRYAIPFLVQFWLFATPIAYPSSLLDEPWRTLFGLNPMTGVVEGFRWALLGTDTAPGPMIAASIGAATLVFLSGLIYFRRVEHRFADVI